jgi:hypothetical protein
VNRSEYVLYLRISLISVYFDLHAYIITNLIIYIVFTYFIDRIKYLYTIHKSSFCGLKFWRTSQHVYMRPVRKSQNFQSIHQAIFFFRLIRWLLLAYVVPMSRLQPRPVWNVFVFTFIPVWIHAGLKSVGSVQQAGPLETGLSYFHPAFM